MTEKDVIREVMSLRKWSQATLAKKAGYKFQSNVSGLLNSATKGVRTDNLVKLLTAMGCELVVRDKGSGKEWVISEEELTVEQRLKSGKITFEQAVALGWKPSQEMLDKLFS